MTRILVALAILAVLGYGVFEARKLIEGPSITITSPQPWSATSTTGVLIAGEAQNIAFLTINDAPAYTDESGHFAELLSPPPGVTVLTVAAVDRFGRRVSKSVSINVLDYCPVNT
jgi:hypothetical protein